MNKSRASKPPQDGASRALHEFHVNDRVMFIHPETFLTETFEVGSIIRSRRGHAFDLLLAKDSPFNSKAQYCRLAST